MKSKKSTMTGKSNRREQIVSAAEALMRERGLTGVTTRAIAEAVPCSEGAIYVHFADRLELLLAVLQESLPEMLVSLHALTGKVGTGTPRQNLSSALQGLMRFHERVIPMLCSVMMEPELHRRFQRSIEDAGKGPDRGILTLAAYIDQEQKLGRIAPGVSAPTAASVLMASSFFHLFTTKLLGSTTRFDTAMLIDLVLGSSKH